MSKAKTNHYETLYILKSALSDADCDVIHAKVDTVISKFSGQLKSRDNWGLRELSYPIEKETMGKYSVIHYTGQGGVVEEIERHFKISPDVIRFMTVKTEPAYDYNQIKKQIVASEEEARRNKEARKAAREARF